MIVLKLVAWSRNPVPESGAEGTLFPAGDGDFPGVAFAGFVCPAIGVQFGLEPGVHWPLGGHPGVPGVHCPAGGCVGTGVQFWFTPGVHWPLGGQPSVPGTHVPGGGGVGVFGQPEVPGTHVGCGVCVPPGGVELGVPVNVTGGVEFVGRISPKLLLTPKKPAGSWMLKKRSFPVLPPGVPMVSLPSRYGAGWFSFSSQSPASRSVNS